MAMSNADKLVYMANQIARNLEAQGHDQAVTMTAAHIVKFWDSRMKARIAVLAVEQGETFSAIAREAVARLPASASTD